MKKRAVMCMVILVACFAAPTCYAAPVSGYNSYIQALPGGKARQAENFNIIDQAQKEVVSLEGKRRKREIRFVKPVRVDELNLKYVMVAFEVEYKPVGNSRFSTDPAIYGLLFEKDDSPGITRFTSHFIKWLNPKDVDEYKLSTMEDFRKYFRHLGVDDCVAPKVDQTVKTAKRRIEKKEEPQDIDGNRIVSGIVKAQYIDPEIARKKDLEAAIQKIESLAIAPEKDKEIPASNVIFLLEKRYNEEKKMREQLEKRLVKLERLLKNVSLKNNELTFEGVNVRIVNGTHSSQGDGNGNLIMGYIENSSDQQKIKHMIGSFSHKIITVEEKREDGSPLLPDYGQSENAEDLSLIRFLLK